MRLPAGVAFNFISRILLGFLAVGCASHSPHTPPYQSSLRNPSSTHVDCAQIATQFLDPSQRQHFMDLAQDPAHNFHITPTSLREAEIGMELEKTGILPGPLERDLSGHSEFKDAEGVLWDVKAFHSTTPNGAVIPTSFMKEKIEAALASGENLILDRTHLSASDQASIDAMLTQENWKERALWFPPLINVLH